MPRRPSQDRKSPEPSDPFAAAPMSDSLRALARRGVLLQRRKGALLITEGDVGDTIYVVLAGRLRAYSVGADEREITYGVYGPGEYVGEMGLDGGPRAAHVEALEATLCAVIARQTLEQHLREDPAFAFELLSKVIWRARAATQGLKQIALNNVYGRLRALFEELAVAQPDGTRLIDPAPTHKELGHLLGCTREMVSKVTKELEKGGYTLAERRRIQLLRTLPMKW